MPHPTPMPDVRPARSREDPRPPHDGTGAVFAMDADTGSWPILRSRALGALQLRSAGIAVVAIGLLGMVGHIAGIERLVQPLHGLVPVPPLGAWIITCAGLALIDPTVRGHRLGRAAAIAAVVLAALAALALAAPARVPSSLRLYPGGPAAWLVTGLGLLALRSRRPRLEARAFIGACGLAAFAIGGFVLALNAAVLVGGSATTVPLVAQFAPHGIIALLLTGGALLAAMVAMPARAGSPLPRWAAWVVGTAAVACSIAVWRAVAEAQEGELTGLVTAKAAIVRAGIEDALADAGVADESTFVRIVRAELPRTGENYLGALTRSGFTTDTLGTAVPETGTAASRFVVRESFRAGAYPVVLHVWPTAGLVAVTRTNLPELVLLLGVLLSGLLGTTLRLVGELTGIARREERAELLLALAAADRASGYEWDVRTDNVLRSPAIARQLGLEPERLAVTAGDWLRRIHPDDRPAVDVALREHLAGRAPEYVVRYRVQAGDGAWHTVIDRGRVVERERDGTPVRVVGLCVNLDAQEPVPPSPFALGTLAQAMLAPNGHVITHTRAAERFLVPHEETAGHRLATAGDTDALALAHLLHVAHGEGTARGELRLAAPDGGVHEMDLAVTALRDAGGRRGDELLVELWDVTGRRAAEAARAEADRLMTLGRLAARVAHEINNPLAGIRTAFQLVKRGLPPDHSAWPFAEAIEREIQRIAAVTRQLYETYRPDHSPPTSAVATVVGDCVALLGETAKGRGITVTADLAEAPARVEVPEAALRQAVYNLVQNAIEASPRDGTVTIVVREEDGALRLVVRDEGPGIPREQRERVFDEGFTTKAGSVSTSGLGIGLALVRHSVTSLGGTITVHDATVGSGAEFRVSLPLAATRVPAGATIA